MNYHINGSTTFSSQAQCGLAWVITIGRTRELTIEISLRWCLSVARYLSLAQVVSSVCSSGYNAHHEKSWPKSMLPNWMSLVKVQHYCRRKMTLSRTAVHAAGHGLKDRVKSIKHMTSEIRWILMPNESHLLFSCIGFSFCFFRKYCSYCFLSFPRILESLPSDIYVQTDVNTPWMHYSLPGKVLQIIDAFVLFFQL